MHTNYTIPATTELSMRRKLAPGFMRPNRLPMAVVYEAVLDEEYCDAISAYCAQRSSQTVGGCNASATHECPRPLSSLFNKIVAAGALSNFGQWDFELDPDPMAWMQTYGEGNDYHRHTDADIGQSRKLTAVAMLSPANAYQGGDLLLVDSQNKVQEVPRTQGTVVVFPSWVPHEVTPITGGLRQTINMGWWGPPFK